MGVTHLSTCKYLNARMLRYSMYLEQCDYEIRQTPGEFNIVADCLSRVKIEPKIVTPTNFQ